MKTYHILAIAPYDGMAELLASISKTRTDLNLTIRTGNLEDGLAIAQELTESHDYDLVLSRGGTAELIRKELPVMVSEVQFSVYDLLRCIKMAETYGGKSAIVGFSGITSNAKILCDLLQISFKIVTLKDHEEAFPRMQELKQEDYSLVICDMISYNTARQIGLNAIFVPSGAESIQDALNHAVQLIDATSHLKRHTELLKNALLSKNEYVSIYDPHQRLWFSTLNTAADLDAQFKAEFQALVPELLRKKNKSIIKQVRDITYEISNQTLEYHGEQFIMLKITRKPMLFEPNDKTILIYGTEEEDDFAPSAEASSANLVGKTHSILDKYAPATFPVLITGEAGTGKERAAMLLYSHGPYPNRPYYVIDCSLINERKWNTILSSNNSPLNEAHVTIHFRNIGKLSKTEFYRLMEYMDNTKLTKRNRVLFSMILPDPDAEEMKNYLTNKAACLHLALVPLRERMEDLSSIAILYINQLNNLLGKQIIGFESDAFDLIRNYSWPGNLEQFRHILKELVVITDSFYISAENTTKILAQERHNGNAAPSFAENFPIDLTQPLEQIEHEIISIVLAQENMNKEKAAQRLGISRTTLWRMLKNHS